MVAKIGVNSLAPVGRWAAETGGTVVKDVAHFGTPVLAVEPEIESPAQPDPADAVAASDGAVGLTAGREYRSNDHS